MGYYSSLWLQSYIGVPGLVLLNILIVILWALVFYKTLAFIFFTIKKHIPKRTKPINEEDEVEENANENETADNNDDTSETAEENDDENPLESNQEEEEEERQNNNKANETMPYRINAANDSEILSDIDTTQEQDIASQLDNTTVDSNEIDGTITVSKPIEQGDEKRFDAFDPTKELSKYKMPPLDLLRDGGSRSNTADIDEQENNKRRITETLANYDIQIKKIDVCVGPTISLFEIQPCEGVRIAKIKNLSNDIQMSLAALGIRIIAPIPGKCTVGIEVPNKDPQTVYMRTILGSAKFQNCKMDLPMALGCTITNDVAIADLAKMPHLLVAGATGQGKSVGLNAIIASLLYKKHPSELKLVLIDPKMVEFSLYSKLEHHYLAKLTGENECIVIEPKKAIATLNSLVQEMENRNLLLRDAGERNIKDYNAKFIARRLNPEKGHRYMPYIVLVVDEYADLVMTGGKEVERPIARIAQKARAVGIHMIIATQRPSTDVITGMIKANFPGRIAFKVVQMVDSRTILDCPGAEQLVGRGDMLFSAAGSVVERIQCAFIDTPEVESICDYISSQVGYDEAYELPEYIPDTDEQSGGNDQGGSMNLNDRDPLFDEIAQYIVASDTASTSSLQRHYNIGYNRAGRIMDQMEAAGIVGPAQGGKPRKVLIDATQLQSMLAQKLF
ncbi:MAG TPA: DNA translocase FtsK [Candidatus Avimuribaculum pullicola]|nr:DNA translocase FtsK [Candidatus Avimuribaculum pullicola]